MNTISKTLLVMCASSLCRLAQADSEQRELSGFTEVAVASGINLEIRQGGGFAVEVDSAAGDMDDIVTEVVNGTLRIYTDRGWGDWIRSGLLDWFATYDVAVTLPELTALRVSGGSDVNGIGPVTGDRLVLRTSGGSDLDLDIDVDTLDITISGGSDVNLAGSARRVSVRTSGGSDLTASDLSAQEAELIASGGSDIDITVNAKLTAKASGGSDIAYHGDPQDRDINASGGSDVTRLRK